MTLVLDASAAVELLLDTARGQRVALQLTDAMVAPELLDVEVASALGRLERAALLAPAEADSLIAALASLPVDRLPHAALLDQAWALRLSLRIADAFYVSCALLLSATLLTCDARLAAAGLRGVTVSLVQ